MAKHHQYLTGHQKGIVSRFYANQDARVIVKLQELASDLFLTPAGDAAAKKWATVEKELAKTNAPAAEVAKVLAARDAKALASLLARPGLSAERKGPERPASDRDDV